MGENGKEYVTLEDLCGEDPDRDIAETPLERYGGKLIKHRTRVPLNLLIKAQQRYMQGRRRKDMQGYFVHLLKYLLIKPRVETHEQAQALLHADGKVMLDIIGQAVGNVEQMMEEADEAGEA